MNQLLKNTKNKELSIALYFFAFILGFASNLIHSFYNEYRVIEILVLLTLGSYALVRKQLVIKKLELLFFIFLIGGNFFWQQPLFITTDLLLSYLLYKNFHLLNYNNLVTKIIVLSTFLLFLLFPLSLFDYIQKATYDANWYPLPWNIRVYDSYFLVVSILATWLYLTEKKYSYVYLILLFLMFFAILLDAGRSATLAYTAFAVLVVIFNKSAGPPLILTYALSWLAYIAITYAANIGSSSLLIGRESSSGRIDLWINALQCWSQHPVIGCGFYQLYEFPHLSAHPHNLFIQILTETGLIGFGFLALIIFKVVKNISWNLKKNYFVIAALLAVAIDSSLSGVYIYPITQMALLWLFVFLLKNPEFAHAQYFDNTTVASSHAQRLLSIVVFVVIAIWLSYLGLQAFTFSSDMPLTPPRFWIYGYQLL